MTARPHVVIIGAGVAGLATALAFTRRGIGVEIYERSPVLSEVGAGLQITPNSLKVLRALGLESAIRASSFQPNAFVGRDGISGRVTFRTPLREACEPLYGADYLLIHRADLQQTLQEAARGIPLHFGAACTGVSTTDQGAVASFADGRTVRADLIVGADGIRSAVRDSLFGPDAPRFTGDMCWRALIPVDGPDETLATPDVTIWSGPRAHAVTYYVRGGRAINLVATYETPDWVEESWSAPGSREEMAAAYKGWHPKLQTLFARAENVFRWGLFDRDPMDAWSIGHATLVGDAAHAMLPYLAQGAAQAVEDAWVLAAAVDENGMDIPAALRTYEDARRPRTSKIQLRAREQGRQRHLVSPTRRIARNLVSRVRGLINPQKTGLRADWIYAEDVTANWPARAA
jgi:salicylate hydroxylase